MRKLACAMGMASAVVFASGAYAQTPPPADFTQQISQASLPLGVGPNGFSGAGAAVLGQAVADSQYVLIGESHMSREIPVFTTQVCRLMAPTGLTAMAIETGPEAARAVGSVMRSADREARIADLMRQHPDAVAFFNGRDEGQMAADCAAAAGANFELWGLDQEFLGAGGYLLGEMLKSNPGPVARAAIEAMAAQAQAATAAALESGSPVDLFLFAVTQDTLDQAGVAIARDGGERAQYLFGLLTESHAIYHASQSRAGDPNGRRARLMKRTLAAHLTENPKARVLMKFGAWHIYKSLNPLNQRDIGAYVAERADGEGVNALHIMVMGAKGTAGSYAGVGRAVTVQPFDITEDEDADWGKDVLLMRPAEYAPGDWTLIDLRKLRAGGVASAPTEWRNLALGYDIAILAPTLSATTVLGVVDEPKP